MLDLRSSNPALTRISEMGPGMGSTADRQVATINGIVGKTVSAVSLAVVGGLFGCAITTYLPGFYLGIFILACIASLVCYIAVWRNPTHAQWGTPIYSIFQGASMGALAAMMEMYFVSRGVPPSMHLGLQALIITMSAAFGTLAIYRMGWIRLNNTGMRVVSALVAAVCLAYLANLVLMFFGMDMQFMSVTAAIEGGKAAMWGLAFNVFVLVIACLMLVMNFQQADDAVSSGMPRELEWFFAFGIVVTLVWIYVESLKLAARLTARR